MALSTTPLKLTRSSRNKLLSVVAAGAAAITLAACGSTGSDSTDDNSGSSDSAKIGLLLPESTVVRWNNKDKPYFEDGLHKECPDCELLYANADADASKQLQQAQSMLTQGAKVLVVAPFDAVAAAAIVQAAKAKDVPVISYERLIASPDLAYGITNDYTEVGKLQGTALVEQMKKLNITPSDGGVIMIRGEATSPNAAKMAAGALPAIKSAGFEVLGETSTYDPTKAQDFTASMLTKYGDKIVGIYSANDDDAKGAIAALKARGVKTMPPITGLDATVSGLQNIVTGDQYMTVYNSIKEEAAQAAKIAVQFANGEKPKGTTTVDGIPTYTMPHPTVVTVENMMSTIIKDGFWSVSDICTKQYKAKCSAAGIK